MIDDGTFLLDRIFLNPMNIYFHFSHDWFLLRIIGSIELENTDTPPPHHSTGGAMVWGSEF